MPNTARLRPAKASSRSLAAEVESVVAALHRAGSKRVREEMGTRYGITGPTADKSFGVPMEAMQRVAKSARSRDAAGNHALALALWDWEGGWYEPRMVASLIDDPALVTAAQMDRWCRDFDNWGIVDTVCFKLFDRVAPALAFRKVDQWSRSKDEFGKRGAFALLACLALHSKDAADADFTRRLPLIERAATDGRNFVKKGVSWALRSIALRSPSLRSRAREVAERLAASDDSTARWIGRDALRQISKGR